LNPTTPTNAPPQPFPPAVGALASGGTASPTGTVRDWWVREGDSTLILSRAPVEEMLRLLALGRDAPLSVLFDWEELMRVFLLTFPRFVPRSTLLTSLHKSFVDARTLTEQLAVVQVLTQWTELDRGSDFVLESPFFASEATSGSAFDVAFEACCKSIEAVKALRPSARLLRRVRERAQLISVASVPYVSSLSQIKPPPPCVLLHSILRPFAHTL
jgi:hypothetical protein